MKVDSDPPKSFFASFDLKGSPDVGELALFTPLGTTLAVLSWAPRSAVLRANGQSRSFDSLDALALGATGTAIPIANLFEWLAGNPSPASGWQADLSQLGDGRITALRITPPPGVELKVLLDQ